MAEKKTRTSRSATSKTAEPEAAAAPDEAPSRGSADEADGGGSDHRPDVPGAGATSLLSDFDVYLFNEGRHRRIHDKLGAHVRTVDGVDGVHFAVWAPNANYVSVIGDFNGWDKSSHELAMRGESGIWELFVPGVGKGDNYKFHIGSHVQGYQVDKADPYAIHSETPPYTASKIWDLDYEWDDDAWMQERAKRQALDQPWSIYELHPGSWRRMPEQADRSLSYRELAEPLIDYIKRLGFTHVEFMPLTEYPFGGSWGYQVTGYFAPTSRYGTPQDLKYLIDQLHQHDIGVIMDWVPSHFPSDEHGLAFFDGTHLYEHADPRKGYHPDWNSYIFNYGRNEVQSFLMSSALFWLDEYHVDGLRVDGVASMLYLDYSREEGEWIPNEWGGNENIEAIDLLRRFNTELYQEYPGIQTIAEESTAWPMVSRPTYVGGLGFGMKWDMGWMHDTLEYLAEDPVHRKYHHNALTFRALYAFTENYCLPLSHDEVVHGKGSLINKMPGDDWQKFANLRALFGYMFTQPGKKMLFMGDEIGQWQEWSHDRSIDWHLLDYERHHRLQRCVSDLNHLYREVLALYDGDLDPKGFEWIDATDWEQSVICYLRKSRDGSDQAAVLCNFTPMPRHNYRVGLPTSGYWREIFNTDAIDYGGSGVGNYGGVETAPLPCHGRDQSVLLTLPPLSVLVLQPAPVAAVATKIASADEEDDGPAR